MKLNLKTASSLLFFFLASITILYPVAFKSDETSCTTHAISQKTTGQPVQNVTFKLLAVEAYFNNTALRSAQHLIRNLRLFSNWCNGTMSAGFQYFNYIHLFSNVPYEEIEPDCQPFFRGNATRAKVIHEITTFLNRTEEDNVLSVLVFYYVGYSNKIVQQGNTTYYMALDTPLFDWELNQTLPSCTMGSQKSTVVILDTAYSGGYIAKLACPGRVVLAACNPVERPIVGWFTGNENASYLNGTDFGPLGIIGGIQVADDLNNDGWLSADEVFRFAWRTLTYFAANQTNPETSTPYSLHPWASYGVAGGGAPFVQHNQSDRFPGNGKVCNPRSILPTSSRYDWKQFDCPTYRQSPSRTGFASAPGSKTASLLWALSLNYSVTTSAVAADGMVFIGTMGGTFYALDMATGKVVWSFITNSAVSSSPAVEDGIVIFGIENPGKIYALDAYTGLVRWIYEIPAEAAVYSSPAIFDGMVFIGCSDGYLRCFSQFEGKLIWDTYLDGGRLSSPAIADSMVFITSPHVYAVELLTGKLVWKYVTSWPVISSPAVADGLVFVGAENDDKAFALEQDTGRLVWSFRTGGWLTSPAVDSYRHLVILGCRDARVYCLDEHTGFLEWEYINAPNHLSAPTISTDGLVYTGSSDGNLYCINEETGEEVWKYTVVSPIVSSPSIIYEHVIVASQKGEIFCFGPPYSTHNIAVSNATASPLELRVGEFLEINCTIKNYGSIEETTTIVCATCMTPQCSELIIIHSENITLPPRANFTYVYLWNTFDAHPGFYTLSVQPQLIPDETDASDNTYFTDTIRIVSIADLDANGQIDIIDISIAANAYGSVPREPNWNPEADLNNDDLINILDIAFIAMEFGKTYV